MNKLLKYLLVLGLLFGNESWAETCSGIAPKPPFDTVTAGYNFANCNSVCGNATNLPYAGVPPQWNWTVVDSGTWAWGILPTVLGYPAISFRTGAPQFSSPPTTPVAYPTPWTCESNMVYNYDPFAGPNSIVGVSGSMGGTSKTDYWLRTTKRVFHIAGGEQIKCVLNSDGVNAPFIIVANNQVVLGWVMGTPLTANGATMSYQVAYGVYPLDPGEVPRSFNLSAASGGGAKWCRQYFYGATGAPYVDSGLRVHKGNQNYSIAAEAGMTPVSPIRISKSGKTLGLVLVDVGDPNATPARMQTKSGIKALRSYP